MNDNTFKQLLLPLVLLASSWASPELYAQSGTAELDVSNVNCPVLPVNFGSIPCTGAATITAVGGPVTLGSGGSYAPIGTTWDSSGVPGSLRILPGTCTSGLVLSEGSSCSTGEFIVASSLEAGTINFVLTPEVAARGGSPGPSVLLPVQVKPAGIAQVSSVTCGEAKVGTTKDCGTITVTAEDGPVFLQAGSPFGVQGDTDQFSVAAGATKGCVAAQLLDESDYCTLDVEFKPTRAGEHEIQVSARVTYGTSAQPVVITGIGVSGKPVVTPSSVDCGEATPGSSKSCGPVTITASGGPIKFASTPVTVSSGFSVSAGSCAPNSELLEGHSCTTGEVTFRPTTTGSKSGTLTINCGANCSTSVALSGAAYTYSWVTGDFGPCEGGSGSWMVGDWAPTMGCGEVVQTRSVTCSIEADSGRRTRSVTCRRSDGETADPSWCSSEAPEAEASCTPSDTVCGPEPSKERTTTLDTLCGLPSTIRKLCDKDSESSYCVLMSF